MLTYFGCNMKSLVFMTFKIHVQLHHRIGSLIPPSNGSADFVQLYFVDNDNELVAQRRDDATIIEVNLVKTLQNMMHDICAGFQS